MHYHVLVIGNQCEVQGSALSNQSVVGKRPAQISTEHSMSSCIERKYLLDLVKIK